MDILEILNNALNEYREYLKHTGYANNNIAVNLLTLVMLQELIPGPFSMFITDKDLKIINRAMSCLSKSCFIEYPYREGCSLLPKYTDKCLRQTEHYNPRGYKEYLRIEN